MVVTEALGISLTTNHKMTETLKKIIIGFLLAGGVVAGNVKMTQDCIELRTELVARYNAQKISANEFLALDKIKNGCGSSSVDAPENIDDVVVKGVGKFKKVYYSQAEYDQVETEVLADYENGVIIFDDFFAVMSERSGKKVFPKELTKTSQEYLDYWIETQ